MYHWTGQSPSAQSCPLVLQQGRNLLLHVIAKPAWMIDKCRSLNDPCAAGHNHVLLQLVASWSIPTITAWPPSPKSMGPSCFSHGDKAKSVQMLARLCPMSCSMQCACRMHSSHQAMGHALSKECVNGKNL